MPVLIAQRCVAWIVGMHRLTVEDEFLVLTDTDETPMLIGALQFYDVPDHRMAQFYPAILTHFEKRLPETPLLRIRRDAPLNFDTSFWLEVADCDLHRHIERLHPDRAMTRQDINRFVERVAMERVDLRYPPFKVYVLDNLEEPGAALFIKIHHALADGIGFQNIMGLLHDEGPEPVYTTPPRRVDEPPPNPLYSLWQSHKRFRAEQAGRANMQGHRIEARRVYDEFKAEPEHKRLPTPVLKLTRPTSQKRRYETITFPLASFRKIATSLGGTINDVFLALVAEAMRQHLSEIDDLPEEPIVGLAPRSYRNEERDGLFGNRIMSLNPCLYTDVEDLKERFRAIQNSMQIELQRSRLLEALHDFDDRPFGARRRRKEFARRLSGGGSILAGNLSISNVPGPKEARYMAGFKQLANYPAPTIGAGQFLSVILRRYEEQLDFGIMVDPEQITNIQKLKQDLSNSLETLLEIGQ